VFSPFRPYGHQRAGAKRDAWQQSLAVVSSVFGPVANDTRRTRVQN
jgi:hypothetical protein